MATKKEPIEYDYDEEVTARDEAFAVGATLTRHAAIALQNGNPGKATLLAELGKKLTNLAGNLERHGSKTDYLMTSEDRRANRTPKVR